jgi:hypothetical protein
LLHLISNYAQFADNPQAMLLSLEGSFLGGLVGAVALAYWKYYEVKKTILPQPKVIEEKVNGELNEIDVNTDSVESTTTHIDDLEKRVEENVLSEEINK